MIIFGKNTVREAIVKKRPIKSIYTSIDKWLFDLEKSGVELPKVKIVKMSNPEMDKMFKGNHQGIVVEIEEYSYESLNNVVKKNKDKEHVSLIMLDGLEDPHNLGAILRTADATGMNGIIIPKNRSVSLNATVAKVSTGLEAVVGYLYLTNNTERLNYIMSLIIKIGDTL